MSTAARGMPPCSTGGTLDRSNARRTHETRWVLLADGLGVQARPGQLLKEQARKSESVSES